jgi:hypothetical protein
VHWLAGRRIPGLWILPDEAIYADRAISLWRHGSLSVLHGDGAGYSVLYPAVAGLPLSVGSIATGYASLKLLQALVISLTAVPLVFYGRRLMPTGWALLAGALALASPLLLYSGLVMTEVLYYPLATIALLGIARAIETASTRDQVLALLFVALAVLTRVQAVVLIAVFAAAIVVDALLGRDRRRLAAFWPVWSMVAVAAIAAAARPGVFGAYAGTVSGSYPLAESLRLVYDHAAYAILMVAVMPAAALVVLLVAAVRGGERDRRARALIAVATCAFVLVTLQVGLFAARYAPHLLGRDLAALPPILFLVFALWLARGAPRPGLVASVAIVGVLAVVVGAPWNTLATDEAIPDTPDISFAHHGYAGLSAASLVAIVAASLLVLWRFVPRLLLPAAVLAALVVASIVASNTIAVDARFTQAEVVGSPPGWVDRKPATLVVTQGLAQNVAWQQWFWNPSLTRVLSVSPAFVPAPMRQVQTQLDDRGSLPTAAAYAVGANDVAFVGTPIAHHALGSDFFGLTLWRLSGPPRVSYLIRDLKPNGDIVAPVQVTAFNCAGGRLELTLLPKTSHEVFVFLDGKLLRRAPVHGASWTGAIAVPARHGPSACAFVIRGDSLLGSTRIAFVR